MRSRWMPKIVNAVHDSYILEVEKNVSPEAYGMMLGIFLQRGPIFDYFNSEYIAGLEE